MFDTAEYGMFTDQGNELIDDVIKLANRHQLHDRSINAILLALAENEAFDEAADTVVREKVFASLERSSF